MATCDHIFGGVPNIIQETIKLVSESHLELYLRNKSAITIQKTWRGTYERNQLDSQRDAAVCIQRWVRGFLVRRNFPFIVADYLHLKHLVIYNACATKIQALWRGYSYRKSILNYHKEYCERMHVIKNNEELKIQMQEELLNAEEIKKTRLNMEAKQMVLYIIFKLHHYLRTTTKEGTYSLHGQQKLSRIEELLKSIKFRNYMKEVHNKYNATHFDKRLLFKVPKYTNETKYVAHKKPFSLDPRVNYDKLPMVDNKEPFKKQIHDIERYTDWKKHVSNKDFDITAKKVPLKTYPPPYYVDFWSRGCDIHDIEL